MSERKSVLAESWWKLVLVCILFLQFRYFFYTSPWHFPGSSSSWNAVTGLKDTHMKRAQQWQKWQTLSSWGCRAFSEDSALKWGQSCDADRRKTNSWTGSESGQGRLVSGILPIPLWTSSGLREEPEQHTNTPFYNNNKKVAKWT